MTGILKIRDVFDKTRDPLRDLNTIIKVYDTSPDSIWVEFEEFILTEALLKYLHDFCNDFMASPYFASPKMPIWLEGFYGSGKSHFSKIIGLLFQNSEILTHDKSKINAFDFFIDRILRGLKFKDPKLEKLKGELITNLELFPKQFNCKTIFINLSRYSKSEDASVKFVGTFAMALLREFNDFLGLSKVVETAELEKNLIKDGIYDRFKDAVYKSMGESWEEIRKTSPRARRVFLEIYPKIASCDSIIAQEYWHGAEVDITQKNVEDILEEINLWAEKNLSIPEKGIQGKILIILDEAGIFFSAAESRIGELLSAAEWIHNPVNKSRINMILNAQQNIKKYLDAANITADFHKSEQRFKHWFLDKRNIKTVVVQRWLKKDSGFHGKELETFIDKHYPKIIDGTVFNTVNDPNLEYIKPSREEIVETYPFLPSQFPMMIEITQKLITERLVEEEYGGKTRSILTITREILESRSPYSRKPHFIEDELGEFVNIAQIYDCILYTLRKKEEDQTILVDKTKQILEDPANFTPDELKIPVTFFDVAKAVFLLQFVDEVFSNEYNIAKALYHSINLPKNIFEDKVRKLVEILKKKGYIGYKKRMITDDEGKPKEILEYKITSKEERKFIEDSFNIHITDENIDERLLDFFQNSIGKDLITFKDSINLPTLEIQPGKEYKLKNAIKIKLDWYIDPDFDEIPGKIKDDPNIVTLCIFTPRNLLKNKDEIQKLQKDIIVLNKRLFQKKQNLVIITPSLTQTIDEITSKSEVLVDYLKESKRYELIIKKPTTPANIVHNFIQMIQDLDKKIFDLLKGEYENGFLFYGDGTVLKIGKDTINKKILEVIKETYSKINKYAHLGQTRITTTDIVMILKWDPKLKTKIPGYLKKSEKEDFANLPLFNEEGNDLQPHLCEQHGLINIEFKRAIDAGSEFVSGERLLDTFQSAPYSWKNNTTLGVIATLLRNNEWNVWKGGQVRNPDDKEIINAFTDSKKDYQKFRALHFKIAEKLTHEQLQSAADLLRDLFNERITTPGQETLNLSIIKVFEALSNIITEIRGDLEKLELRENVLQQTDLIHQRIKDILKINRPNERIKSFIEVFEIYGKSGTQSKEFEELQRLLYRLQELKTNNQLSRYFYIKEFLEETITDWFKLEPNLSEIDELKALKTQILEDLKNPTILLEENWNQLWTKNLPLWKGYWESYIHLHQKLLITIENTIVKIEQHKNYGNLKPNQIEELKNIFKCRELVVIPEKISSNIFNCTKCNDSYAVLKNWESSIEKKIGEIERILQTEPPPIPRGLSEPSGKQLEIWTGYKKEHQKIEQLFKEIVSQKSLYEDKKEKLDLIDQFIGIFTQKYPDFPIGHSCSEMPVALELKKLTCSICKKTYDDLIDITAFLKPLHETLIAELTKDEEKTLPYNIEFSLNGQSEKGILNAVQEKSQLITTFVTNYYKKSDPKEKLKVKIVIDKGD